MTDERINPQWGQTTRFNDWRDHVPDYIRERWDSFTIEQKHVLVLWAKELAHKDEWQ